MEIQHVNNEKNGFFKAVEDNKQGGMMTYVWAGTGVFIIDYTEVDLAFKGKSVGKKMVLAAVDYARNNDLKIIPLCPFAKSVFERTEEIRDVLKQ